jgi:hypothetical protein
MREGFFHLFTLGDIDDAMPQDLSIFLQFGGG